MPPGIGTAVDRDVGTAEHGALGDIAGRHRPAHGAMFEIGRDFQPLGSGPNGKSRATNRCRAAGRKCARPAPRTSRASGPRRDRDCLRRPWARRHRRRGRCSAASLAHPARRSGCECAGSGALSVAPLAEKPDRKRQRLSSPMLRSGRSKLRRPRPSLRKCSSNRSELTVPPPRRPASGGSRTTRGTGAAASAVNQNAASDAAIQPPARIAPLALDEDLGAADCRLRLHFSERWPRPPQLRSS